MILCIAVVGTLLIGCSAKIDSNYKHLTNTAKDGDGVYTDLWDYVIEIADYKDADFDAASKALEDKYEIIDGACTACAKLDSKGNVLIGRNLDNQISQSPAFFITQKPQKPIKAAKGYEIPLERLKSKKNAQNRPENVQLGEVLGVSAFQVTKRLREVQPGSKIRKCLFMPRMSKKRMEHILTLDENK